MSTSCQNIIDRAKSFSPLNASLATDPVEMLTRIGQIQQHILTTAASVSKDRFQSAQTLTSTAGSSGRVVDLSTLTVPLERLLTVTLPDGREARQVDIQDLEAELSPRYIVRGQRMIEVSNDWSATANALNIAIVYVNGALLITPTSATTQLISIPDQWADLLIRPLAMYFHTKDPGRDPSEYERISAEHDAYWQAFMAYLTNYGGVKAQRFNIPAPTIGAKK